MGLKHRQKLQANEEVLNKRKKELINEKKWLIQSYIWELVLEFVCLDLVAYILMYYWLFWQYFSIFLFEFQWTFLYRVMKVI